MQRLTEEALQGHIDRLSDICAGDQATLADRLSGFLFETLRLDLVALRLLDVSGTAARDVILQSNDLPREKIHALLASSVNGAPQIMTSPSGTVTALRLSLGACGALLAGCVRKAFPRPWERLLLTAAVGQARAAFEGAKVSANGSSTSAQSLSDGRHLQQIIDKIPALAWVCTPNSLPQFFNQYYLEYVGRSWEQMMGDGWSRNLHPQDVAGFAADWAAIMASKRPGDIQARMRRADGEFRWFVFRCNPLLDDAGNVIQWFGVNTDIDERKHVEDMLRDTQAQLAHVARALTMGQLTASLAHEINQPLSAIITNASACLHMLSASPPNIEGAVATAHRTIRDGNRAAEVIARLRTLFSRQRASVEPVNLNDAVQEVIMLVSNQLQRMNVSLQVEMATELPILTGDRIQLQQVIMNLILNAAESMADVHSRQREITVSSTLEGSDVRISVKDLGIGLGAVATEKLFTPFYTTKKTGMGIGLSVSRSIVENHHGRIWVEPNDGPGSTFIVSIPFEQRK